MPTVSEDGSFVTFSDEEAVAFRAAGGPESTYLDELINSYALVQGGEVLAVWECLQGPRLGRNIKWSPDRIAAHLEISQARMDQILDDTMAAVRPAWEASPHYAASCAACQKAHSRAAALTDCPDALTAASCLDRSAGGGWSWARVRPRRATDD